MNKTWQRIEVLDTLRAIAALTVLIHHVQQQFHPFSSAFAVPILAWWGGWGVSLFFLLSGFCIHYPFAIARANGVNKQPGGGFVKARLLRILPAYVVALIVCGLLAQQQVTLLVQPPTHRLDYLWHILFLHNFFPGSVDSINAVFWTIGLEMQFYALYWKFHKFFSFSFLQILLLAILGLFWYYVASTLLVEPWRGVMQNIFIKSFWVWCLGACLARRYVDGSMRWSTVYCASMVVLNILAAFWDPVVFKLHVIYWMQPILCAGLLWSFLSFRGRAPLSNIGTISYSLYLFHPVALAFAVHVGSSWAPLLGIVSALMLAAISYRIFEQPFINIKRHSVTISY